VVSHRLTRPGVSVHDAVEQDVTPRSEQTRGQQEGEEADRGPLATPGAGSPEPRGPQSEGRGQKRSKYTASAHAARYSAGPLDRLTSLSPLRAARGAN
jgi:hypothetical protein